MLAFIHVFFPVIPALVLAMVVILAVCLVGPFSDRRDETIRELRNRIDTLEKERKT